MTVSFAARTISYAVNASNRCRIVKRKTMTKSWDDLKVGDKLIEDCGKSEHEITDITNINYISGSEKIYQVSGYDGYRTLARLKQFYHLPDDSPKHWTGSFDLNYEGTIVLTQPFPDDMTVEQLFDYAIRKWKYIVRQFEYGYEVKEDGGCTTCSFCKVHSCHSCGDCPIAKYTGRDVCDNTPFRWWVKSKSLAAAKAMVAFLEEVKHTCDCGCK